MPFDLMSIDIPHQVIVKIVYVSLVTLVAVVVNVALYSALNVSKRLNDKRAKTYAMVVKNGISVIVFVVAFYIVLSILGVDVTPLLASAGVIGLIIGLGTKSLVEDLIAGFFLVAQNAIEIGDYVKIDETEGVVETMGLRTLAVKSIDGAMTILPNGGVRKIINFSRRKSNIIIDLPVSASDPVDIFMKAIEKALEDLLEDKELKDSVLGTSRVDGIEEIRAGGQLIVRVVIVTYPERRSEVGRKFRYLLKQEFEKSKLKFA
jgi:small-conductance mechanosensitive channel